MYSPRGVALCAQDKRIFSLEDEEPYDLTMMGGERADVQRRYWGLMNMDMEDTSNIDGTFVAEGEHYFQLMDTLSNGSGYYPIGGLPDKAILVLRREAIVGLVKSLEPSLMPETQICKPATSSAWPWGTHETELLRHLAAAADRWWKNFDPSDNTTAPTNAEVSNWLLSRGVGQRTAEVMATILRVDGLPTGPRK